MAKEIAEVLGAKVRRNGYFEGNDYCVTWTFGHLCSLQARVHGKVEAVEFKYVADDSVIVPDQVD